MSSKATSEAPKRKVGRPRKPVPDPRELYSGIEVWREVPNSPIEVSSWGRVRNIGSEALKATTLFHGYRYVRAFPGGPRLRIRHLVLQAFICEQPPRSWAASLNRRRDDDRIDNLVWAPRGRQAFLAFMKRERNRRYMARRRGKAPRVLW